MRLILFFRCTAVSFCFSLHCNATSFLCSGHIGCELLGFCCSVGIGRGWSWEDGVEEDKALPRSGLLDLFSDSRARLLAIDRVARGVKVMVQQVEEGQDVHGSLVAATHWPDAGFAGYQGSLLAEGWALSRPSLPYLAKASFQRCPSVVRLISHVSVFAEDGRTCRACDCVE